MAGGKLISTGVEFPDATTQTTSGLPLTGGALTGAVTTTSTFDGRDVAADGVTADAALPKAGGTMTGTIAGFTSTGIDDNATSTAITIDASENVGLKTTPENYHTSYTGLDIGNGASIMGYGGNNGAWLLENSYLGTDGSWKYKNTSTAALYEMYGGVHNFYVAPSGTADTTISWTTPLTIANTGDVTVGTGNLVIGTSGKGIDFSATSDGSGTMTSEVLDDYETGTWTPTLTGTGVTYDAQHGKYTKIGNLVTATFYIDLSSKGSSSGQITFGGLPYGSGTTNNAYRGSGSLAFIHYSDINDQLFVRMGGSGSAGFNMPRGNHNSTSVNLAYADIQDSLIVSGQVIYYV